AQHASCEHPGGSRPLEDHRPVGRGAAESDQGRLRGPAEVRGPQRRAVQRRHARPPDLPEPEHGRGREARQLLRPRLGQRERRVRSQQLPRFQPGPGAPGKLGRAPAGSPLIGTRLFLRAALTRPESVDICSTLAERPGSDMLTLEDVAAIPLFASLGRADLQHVVEAAADIHLRSGEYAVNEGEERAFFAVISGKIEVTKKMQGVEKTIGWRLPGTVFGEVPITLGTAFPGSFRAAEPSRVLRLDARQYYAVAAAAPQVAVAVGALARERLGRLPGLAPQPPTPHVPPIRPPP